MNGLEIKILAGFQRLVNVYLATKIGKINKLDICFKSARLIKIIVPQEVASANQGNFLVCPFSVETVLALAGAGAREDTATEIYNAVSLPQDASQVQGIYREIIPSFRGNEYYNLSTANKVYIQNDFAVLDSFKLTAVDVFGSEVENTDFVVNEMPAHT